MSRGLGGNPGLSEEVRLEKASYKTGTSTFEVTSLSI
jgi:hypothetical protein